jgi:bis(5'-nucleosidyl)-tetraphosphatase
LTSEEVRSCGVLVFRETPEREFLLLKHPKRWDLPKGRLDPGESDLECALRELWEETGITKDQIRIDSDFRYTTSYAVINGGATRMKSLLILLGFLTQATPIVVTEHQGFQWFPWRPPHQIQAQTIDPLLSEVARFFDQLR